MVVVSVQSTEFLELMPPCFRLDENKGGINSIFFQTYQNSLIFGRFRQKENFNFSDRTKTRGALIKRGALIQGIQLMLVRYD